MDYKISFCTVCMNRSDHLKKTLIKNIENNIKYSNIEFVLLDYNSADDLLAWAKEKLKFFIDSGILNYYRTIEPQYFHRGHAKNMVLRLAQGNILCNVDADNFIGKGFAEYVNKEFNENTNIFLAPPILNNLVNRDVQGRICIKREDFYKIRGFDERFRDYGYDDVDFANKIEKLGRKKVIIENEKFLRAVSHDDNVRISQESSKKNLAMILISNLTPESSDFIFLYKDGVFEKYTAVDHISLQSENLSIIKGNYYKDNDIILKIDNKQWGILSAQKGNILEYRLNYNNREQQFLLLTDEMIINTILLNKALYNNKKIFLENKKSKSFVNNGGFGEGNLTKNFIHKVILD